MKLYAIRDKKTGDYVCWLGLSSSAASKNEGVFWTETQLEHLEVLIEDAPDSEIITLRIEPTKPCEWCDWDGKHSEGSLQQKKLWAGGAVDVLPLLDWTFCPNCGRRLT